jgi:WD40 repeat protein
VISDSNGVLHQWNLQTKREVWNLHTFEGAGGRDALGKLSFSPDGKTMVATSVLGGPVVVWNTSVWKTQTQSAYYAAAFSRDGKFLALGGINHVKLVDPGSLRELRDLELAELTWDELRRDQEQEGNGSEKIPCRVSALAFSPDSKTLAAACTQGSQSSLFSGTIRILKLTSLE